MENVLALILAGGRVDELSVLTFYRPKSAMPFGGLYRVIDFPLSNLMHSGIEKVGILSQYRPYSLINHIGIGASWDFVGRNRGAVILPPFQGITASDWYKGTADAVFQNIAFIQEHRPELVLILSGDHIYHMNYEPMIEYHLAKKADLTIAFIEVPQSQAHRFGVAHIGSEDGPMGGPIISYHEKPKAPRFSWASLTIYLFSPQVLLEVLKENQQIGQSFEFGRDIIPNMIGKYAVYGYKFYDYWGYSKTVQEFWQANMDLLGESPRIDLSHWQVRTNLDHRRIRDRVPARVGLSAEIEDALIFAGCAIEGKLIHSILFPGVKVEKGAIVRDSIVMFDAVVQAHATLDRVIVDVEAEIGEHAHLGYEEKAQAREAMIHSDTAGITIIGQQTVVPPGATIGRDCIIYPNLRREQFPTRSIHSGEIVK